MALNALLKFTQGTKVGDGQALIVTAGTPVLVENSQGALDLGSWKIELLYAPFGSVEFTLAAVVKASSSAATAPVWTFTPDAGVPGTYRIRLTVYSGAAFSGTTDVDIRNVIIRTFRRGLFIPPPQLNPLPLPTTGAGSKPNELNVDGQPFGWAGGTSSPKILNDLFLELDDTLGLPELGPEYVNYGLVVSSAPMTWVGQGFEYGGAFYIPESTQKLYYQDVEWCGITVVPVSYEYKNSKRTHEVRQSYQWPDFVKYGSYPLWSSSYSVINTHTLIDDEDNDRWIAVCYLQINLSDGQGNQVTYRNAEYDFRILNRGEPLEWTSTVRASGLDSAYGSLAAAYSLGGYLWFLTYNKTYRCALNDLGNVTQIESGVGHNNSSNWYYDPRDIYGDGEGRIIRSMDSFGKLQLMRPSDYTVTHLFTFPSDSATFQFYQVKVQGYDAASDRLWLVCSGYVSSVYSTYVVTVTLNRSTLLFEDIRAVNIGSICSTPYDVGRGEYSPDLGLCVMNGKLPGGSGSYSWVLRAVDSGSAISFTSHNNTENGGVDAWWSYYGMNPPLVLSATGNVGYVANPDYDYSGKPPWFEFFQLSSGLLGSVLELGGSEVAYREIPQMERDLSPSNAATQSFWQPTDRRPDTGAEPMVTGLQGWPLLPAQLGGGAVCFHYEYNYPDNTAWEVKALPFLESVRLAYTAPTYVHPIENTEYNGLVYSLSSSITYAQVSLQPDKKTQTQHSTTTSFRIWGTGADSKVGQTNSSSGRKVRFYAPEQVTTYNFEYKLHGLTGRKANPPEEMFVKNAFESAEWQWAVIDTSSGVYGRWVLASRYRPWEHVACSSATTTLFVGKGIARCETGTGPKTVVLPDFADGDDWIIVKDVDNNAAANPITIQRNTGQVSQTIDGGTGNLVIDWDGGCVVLRYDNANNVDGPSNWEVIATNGGGATGGTDANAVHVNVANEIAGLTEKTYVLATDQILLEDSADSYNKKRCRADNLPPFWDSRSFTLNNAQEDDYGNSFAGQASLLVLTPNAGGTLLTGLNASLIVNLSYRKVLVNTGPDLLTLAHETGSSPTNQFSLPNGVNYQIDPGHAVILEYYSGKWYLVGGTPEQNALPRLDPAQLTADTDNWAIDVANVEAVYVTTDASNRNLTGIVAVPGAKFLLVNDGPSNVVVQHLAGSAGTNQFRCATGANITVVPGDMVWVFYDDSAGCWRVK
jgi:hypothetical protein